MTFAFIQAEKANHDVRRLCSVLDVSRSGFYAWRKRQAAGGGRRATSDGALLQKIVTIHVETRGLYGSPRIHGELRNRGHAVSRKRVARIMRLSSIRARRRRAFRRSRSDEHFTYAPNVLARQFNGVTAPHQAWVADGTYIRTGEGWLFLVVVIDLFTRRIVGWAAGPTMDGALTTRAFKAACTTAGRSPTLFHSDRGSEYACGAFRKAVEAAQTTQSMSRTGDCWDNAVAESFFASLKKELVHLTKFSTRSSALSAVFEYVEVFYNRVRLHSSLGYKSPSQFEAAWAP